MSGITCKSQQPAGTPGIPISFSQESKSECKWVRVTLESYILNPFWFVKIKQSFTDFALLVFILASKVAKRQMHLRKVFNHEDWNQRANSLWLTFLRASANTVRNATLWQLQPSTRLILQEIHLTLCCSEEWKDVKLLICLKNPNRWISYSRDPALGRQQSFFSFDCFIEICALTPLSPNSNQILCFQQTQLK